jgi:hypothetical protein
MVGTMLVLSHMYANLSLHLPSLSFIRTGGPQIALCNRPPVDDTSCGEVIGFLHIMSQSSLVSRVDTKNTFSPVSFSNTATFDCATISPSTLTTMSRETAVVSMRL